MIYDIAVKNFLDKCHPKNYNIFIIVVVAVVYVL